MQRDNIRLMATVARSLTDAQFVPSHWVVVPEVKPGALSKLPAGSRTDLVGALPMFSAEWTWLVQEDPVTQDRLCVFPVWAASELWDPETKFPFARLDSERVSMGVWYQVQEFLGLENLGLVEAMLGIVNPLVVGCQLDELAAQIEHVADLDETVVQQCPRNVLDALEWLRV